MADSDFELKIIANTQQAAASLESLSGTLSGLAQLAISAFAGREVIRAIQDITKAASDSENSINALNVALKLSGGYSRESSQHFQDLASQLQKTTTFSDETVLQAVALAKSFNTTNDQAEKLVKSAADLAAGMGIGLTEATSQLGRTLDGTAGRLNEFIPGLKRLTATQLEAGAAIDYVGSRFKGAAEAAGQTFAGSLARAANAFDDLKETLGGYITQNKFVLDAINQSVILFGKLNDIIKQNDTLFLGLAKSGILVFVSAVVLLLQTFLDLDKIVNTVFNTLNDFVVFFSKVPAIILAASEAVTSFDASPLTKLNDQLNNDAATRLKVVTDGLNERKKAIDSIVAVLETYRVKVEETAAAHVRTAKQSSDAIQNQTRAVERLTKAQREQYLQQLTANPIGSIFDRSGNAGVAVPKGGTELDRDIGIGAGLAAAILNGAQGAAKLLSGALSSIANSLLPGIGALVGPLFDILSQGPEKVREMIQSFAKALPDLIVNVVKALPVALEEIPRAIQSFIDRAPEFIDGIVRELPRLISAMSQLMPRIANSLTIALVSKAPEIAVALIQGLIQGIPQMVAGFAQEFLKIPGQFADALIKAINPLSGGAGKGIVGGGLIGGPIGSVIGGIGDLFGFADGGKIPAGYDNDGMVARVSSGELVVDRSTNAHLEAFLQSQRSGPSQDQLLQAASGGGDKNITIQMVLGDKVVAEQLLRLNNKGFRLS